MSGVLLLLLVEKVDIPLWLVGIRNVEARAVVLPNRRNLLIVFRRELDLLKVGVDALLLDTLGDDRVSAVDSPCDEYLGSGGSELLGNLLDDRVLSQLGLANHYANR